MNENLIELAGAWLASRRECVDILTLSCEAAAIIRDLLAVVERLPRTADGVPVVRGDMVWIRQYPLGVVGVPFSGDAVFVASFPDGDWSYGVGETYSTRTAAERAMAEQKGEPE